MIPADYFLYFWDMALRRQTRTILLWLQKCVFRGIVDSLNADNDGGDGMAVKHEIVQYRWTFQKNYVSGSPFEHWHQRMEFIYVVEGNVRIQIGKECRLCVPGDLAVVRSGEIHFILTEQENWCYIATFDPVMFSPFFSETKFPTHFISAQEQKNAGVERKIKDLFDSMYNEKMVKKPLYETLIQAKLLEIYGLLVRHFEDNLTKDKKTRTRLEQFQTIVEYIEAHYAENITLAEVAEVINYNTAYISKLFVTCAGVNFKTYLDDFRIKIAVKLLNTGNYTVSDVAIQCGYDNVRTFYNAFRRVTGQTPSQFRKANV